MRTLTLLKVSRQFLRHHLVAYLGCGVVIAAASVIATAELVLFQALVVGTGIDWASLSVVEAIQLRRQLAGLQVILMLMFLLAAGIALFLVFVGVKDLVMGRQRELATLRLLGASRLQVRRMVALETTGYSALVAVPSVIAGHLLAVPFYALLQSIGVFGEQLRLNIGIYPAITGGVVVLVAAMSGVAAWFAGRDITNRPIVESLEPTAGKVPRRRLVVRLALLAGCLAVVVLLDPGRGGAVGQLSLLVPLLVVVPLAALAPYLVPAVAAAVGWALRIVFPGLALLVAQRARRDGARFAAAILPIVLAVGLLGGFYLGNAPDEALRAREYESLLKADLVVSADDAGTATRLVNEQSLLGVSAASRFGESRSVVGLEQSQQTWLGNFYFADAKSLPQLLALNTTGGSMANVGGTRVASSRSTDQLGDTVTVSVNEQPVQLQIVAILDTELYEGIFADWDQSSALGVTPTGIRIFLQTMNTAEQVRAAVSADVRDHIQVADRSTFIAQQIETRQANTSRSNIAVFGTIYAMAVVSLLQSALTSGTKRREEFTLYRSLGLGRGSILGLVIVETIVLSMVAAILLLGTLTALYLRFIVGAAPTTGSLSLVPWNVVGTALLAATTTMGLATIAGTLHALNARSAHI